MIIIKITSDESPQSIFKKQADAEAMEEWARNSETPPMPKSEWREMMLNYGRRFMQNKKPRFLW